MTIKSYNEDHWYRYCSHCPWIRKSDNLCNAAVWSSELMKASLLRAPLVMGFISGKTSNTCFTPRLQNVFEYKRIKQLNTVIMSIQDYGSFNGEIGTYFRSRFSITAPHVTKPWPLQRDHWERQCDGGTGLNTLRWSVSVKTASKARSRVNHPDQPPHAVNCPHPNTPLVISVLNLYILTAIVHRKPERLWIDCLSVVVRCWLHLPYSQSVKYFLQDKKIPSFMYYELVVVGGGGGRLVYFEQVVDEGGGGSIVLSVY